MRKALSTLILLLIANSATANDSMAELKTGGLALVQTDEISIEEEHLSISPEMIEVEYRFHNSADRNIETLVAFPMPDITGDMDMMIAIPDTTSDNFLDFSVTQDGAPIRTNLQQRVYVNGVDLTDVVAAKSVPLVPMSERTVEALEALPAEVIDEWRRLGLVSIMEYDAGKGWERHPIPIWTLKSAYWWKTTFPANADIKVKHSYRTSLGETVSVTYLDQGKPQGKRYEDYVRRYCIDDAFVRVAQKNHKAEMNGMPIYTEAWISYVLTTGNNWFGPIKSFTLTLDKGDPKNLISFCGEGVKKIGPTTFQMKKTDFYPQKELDILLLKRVSR